MGVLHYKIIITQLDRKWMDLSYKGCQCCGAKYTNKYRPDNVAFINDLVSLVNGASCCRDCKNTIYQISYNFSNPNRHQDFETWMQDKRRKVVENMKYESSSSAALKLLCVSHDILFTGKKSKSDLIKLLKSKQVFDFVKEEY